ncbi:MAG: Gfo/Idh/MocA family oxidoreductase, partial [Pseudomonadota bacterium]|nr:Gfo/Idh/MocA family oxidoreductase [Pseudomonadota bacterium]
MTLHLAEIVSEEPLRVLLVGLGKMGQLHMECLSKMPGVSLVGIVDEDGGKEIAANGIPFARSIDGLANDFAAAVIAVPVERHAEAAVALLARGID